MPLYLSRARAAVVATTATAVGLSIALPVGAHAAAPSRVQVDAAPAWTAQATNTGAVPAASRVSLTAVLQLKDAAGAVALATAVSDPKSPTYGKYVTPAAWRAAYAPTSDQIASVTSWLEAQGFTVGAVPANGRFVSFTGTAQQAESAFGTSIASFDKDGTPVVANAAPVSVPAALASVVAGISGLDTSVRSLPDNSRTKDLPRATTRAAAPALQTTIVGPADTLPPPDAVFRNGTPCSSYFGAVAATGLPNPLPKPLTYAPCGYKPAQLRGAYGLDASRVSGGDGRGVTVAIVDAYASPYILADAQRYATINDPSHPLRSYQFNQNLPFGYTDTDACGASGWYGEETLDVEAVHAMAPAANILYVGGASCYDPDLFAAVNTVVDNGLADIITNSYGDAGEDVDAASIEGQTQSSLQAAAEGISMLFSSGDNGDEIADTGTRQADFPATDPFVTAVGGTSLEVGKTNNYLAETGWGTGKLVLSGGQWISPPPADPNSGPVYLYGAGGGTSRIFPQPAYQAGVVPDRIATRYSDTPARAVPDVAMDADPSTGMLVGQSQTFPDGSIQYGEYRIGGTSLASPLLAGTVAVNDQIFQRSLGFLNPVLYALNGSPAFHDVAGTAVNQGVVRVDYVNGFDASDGTVTSLRTLNQTATLHTRKGWDDVTGVGTVDELGLLATVSSAAKAPAIPVGKVPAH